MAFGTREVFGSMLLRGIMDLIMVSTGNTWRRQSGGGSKRDAIVNRVVANVVHNCPEPPQLVVVPFKRSAISPEGASLAIAIDDESEEDIPYLDEGPNWVSIHQTLDWLVWDPTFTLGGYRFQKLSVWCMQLDLYPLSPYILARQFRQIAGYASAPGSVVIVLYIDQPILELAEACGYIREYDCCLDEIALAEGVPKSDIRGLRIAKFTHEWKRPPTRKELNLAGIPSPREDLEGFLLLQGTDFSLVSPPLTPINEIQDDRTNEETEKTERLNMGKKSAEKEPAGKEHAGKQSARVETAGTELAGTEPAETELAKMELAGTDFETKFPNSNTNAVKEHTLTDLESMVSNDDGPISVGAEVEANNDDICNFTVKGTALPENDDLIVLLIGSAEELGSWNCADAVEMHSEGTCHVANVNLAEVRSQSGSFEYKYALARRDSGTRVVVAWENGENRLFKSSHSENFNIIMDNLRALQWI